MRLLFSQCCQATVGRASLLPSRRLFQSLSVHPVNVVAPTHRASAMVLSRGYSSGIAGVKATPFVKGTPEGTTVKAEKETFRCCGGRRAPQEEPLRKRRAFVALGSNLGDRVGMLEKACNEMAARGIQIKRTSSLWETEPMYVVDQDSFVNGACEVCETFYSISVAMSVEFFYYPWSELHTVSTMNTLRQ